MKKVSEAKDVKLYKRLLAILNDYTEHFPSTGVASLLDDLMETGIKAFPKDKRALEILKELFIYSTGSTPRMVQDFLNKRFSDLSPQVKPVFRNSRKHEVAFWSSGGTISDRVKDLVNMEGKSGFWCDIDGKKVTLILPAGEDRVEPA